MVNIYDLYITRSKSELDYFYKLLHFLQYVEMGESTLQIVHLNFGSREIVPNIKFTNTKMNAVVYTFDKESKTVYETIIYNLYDLIKLYIPRSGINVFIYTGHSDGLCLIKKKVRILRMEDFCEMVSLVNKGQKADLMVFDCCLCGNIGTLYVCYDYTKYVLASSSYQSYLSILQTNNFFKKFKDMETFCKNIIKELGSLEKLDKEAYDSDFSLYIMNEAVKELVNLTLNYKHQFNNHRSYVIDSSYYKDLECCFSDLNLDIRPLLKQFVVFNRYHKTKCQNRKVSKKKNVSVPSQLMIILKRPIKDHLKTKADVFLK